MRENNLTADMIAMSYSSRKPRAKKETGESKKAVPDALAKAPAMQK